MDIIDFCRLGIIFALCPIIYIGFAVLENNKTYIT